MLPPDSGEPIEVGVGGNHGTAVFHRDRRVLSVGDQLPRRTRSTAQPLENLQMIGTRTDDPGRRPFDERRDEGKGVFQGRRRVEYPGIRGDSNES